MSEMLCPECRGVPHSEEHICAKCGRLKVAAEHLRGHGSIPLVERLPRFPIPGQTVQHSLTTYRGAVEETYEEMARERGWRLLDLGYVPEARRQVYLWRFEPTLVSKRSRFRRRSLTTSLAR